MGSREATKTVTGGISGFGTWLPDVLMAELRPNHASRDSDRCGRHPDVCMVEPFGRRSAGGHRRSRRDRLVGLQRVRYSPLDISVLQEGSNAGAN